MIYVGVFCNTFPCRNRQTSPARYMTNQKDGSKMNKKDLRVIKTKRNIKKAFSDLMQKKPLEKITVTEIASLAEINKGTFYLHYADIYELYDEYLSEFIEQSADSIDFYDDFFDAPEQFVRNFFMFISYGSFLSFFLSITDG